MALLTISFILCVIFLLCYWCLKEHYLFWKKLNIPYVKPTSYFWGNLSEIGKKEHVRTRIRRYYDELKTAGPLFGIFFFIKPVAVITDLELLKCIMIKDAIHFNDRGFYYNEKDDPLSAHLFALHGPKWRLLRTKLTPTFTSGKMRLMFPTVLEVGQRLEQKLSLETKIAEDIEIKDILARYTTDVIGSCAFGIECQTLGDKNADFRTMGVRVFEKPKYPFIMNLFLMSIRGLAQKLHIKSIRDDVTQFFTKVVKDTIIYREENKIQRKDFLSLLLELQKDTATTENPLTTNEILAQAFVFFIAGFETSSTLLTFCLYELTMNPDIQEKARAHIEEVLSQHDGQLTYDSMLEMTYLDQILNETLRRYPPLSTIFRKAEIDYQIPNTNQWIPKGTLAAIPIYAIQHDSDIYPNPNTFNPENFAADAVRNRPNVAFLAFGEGARVCIGARFGMMQARIGLIHALRGFKYSKSSKMDYPVKLSIKDFITSPLGGMWLKITKIQ